MTLAPRQRLLVAGMFAVAALLLLAGLLPLLLPDHDADTPGTRHPPSQSSPSPTVTTGLDATPTPSAAPSSPSTTASPPPNGNPDPEPAKPLQFSGDSRTITTPFNTTHELIRLRFHHEGTGNFVVWWTEDTGQKRELVANAVGAYDATRYFTFPADAWSLDVQADAPWAIAVEQPWQETGPALTDREGTGDAALGPSTLPAGTHEWTVTHDGSGAFAVYLYDSHGEDHTHDGRRGPLVTHAGPGTTDIRITLPAGTYYFDMQASGAWRIEVTP